MITDIAAADSAQIFADWGIPVTLEEVATDHDPETGRLEEFASTSTIIVIEGPDIRTPLSATRVHVDETARTFLVRRSDLPSGVVLPNSRLRTLSAAYCVQNVTESTIPGTLVLECLLRWEPE